MNGDVYYTMVLLFKSAGAALIMGAAGYFAMNMSRTMERRNLELRKLYSILLQLKSEIQYMYNPLPDCFRKIAVYAKEPFSAWLLTLSERMEKNGDSSFGEIWQKGIAQLYDQSALKTEDIEPLKELSDKLGSMDVEIQVKAIDYTLLQIERNRTILQSELSQKKKVIATLSMFGGFMTLILLL